MQKGKIIVADDMYMNIHVVRDHLKELGLADRAEFRSNG